MKEDNNVPIIFGCPLVNTIRALVDIRDSKITLRVGDDEATFGVEDGFQGSNVQNDVFNVDEENELEKLEKLMEEEIRQVNRTKPSEPVPKVFKVTDYKTPTSWVSEDNEELVSSDEEDATSKLKISIVEKRMVSMEPKNEEVKHVENKGVQRKIDE